MISLIIAIVVVFFLLWAVETLTTLDPPLRRVLQGAVVLCLIIYMLRFFGLV